jgi:16S rRNA (guanine527-N7)-methyltransferase
MAVNRRLLSDGLAELEVAATDEHLDALAAYIGEIELWNRRINLVKAAGDALIIRHILDSAAGIPVISGLRPSHVLDAGSGAGLPGVVLAIFLPAARFTLLDRSSKRAAFLRSTIALLGLENCGIVEAELSRFDESFDIVCCRAFRPLAVSFESLSRRLAPSGTMVFYKGRRRALERELDEVGSKAEEFESRIIKLTVPYLPEERHLLLFRGTSR